MRIYNNGKDTPRVLFEHSVLSGLAAISPFSFRIPTPIMSLHGTYHEVLTSGAEATLFEYIPGGYIYCLQ